MTVTAQPERIQVQYTGHFTEPAFETLGNPARLYSSLLRHLGPLGVNLRSLSIDLSVLADANVTCLLASHGAVRVWLNRLEVVLRDAQSLKDVEQAIVAAWSAIEETDASLKPVRHEVSLSSWSHLQQESYSSYIQRFVKSPVGHSKTAVLFKAAGESIQLDEAADIPEGLFLQSVVNLGSFECDIERLVHGFRTRFGEQLKALDLEMPLTLK